MSTPQNSAIPPSKPARERSYWEEARTPAVALIFVIPAILILESFASEIHHRSGVEVWIASTVGTAGRLGFAIAPGVLALGLTIWTLVERPRSLPALSTLLGVLIECAAIGVGLFGLAVLLEGGFREIEPSALRPIEPRSWASSWVGHVSTGIYEEAIFRLLLLPLLYRMLTLAGWGSHRAAIVAVTMSSVAFALAHHLGPHGEEFTREAFLFRWAAGVYFSWAFVLRGFAIAAGAHVTYDAIVVAMTDSLA